MTIGQAYQEVLSAREQKALAKGCTMLVDHTFDDLQAIQVAGSVKETFLELWLPPRYLMHYTPFFCRRFAVCIITVIWKLTQLERLRLASVAEELAAAAIIEVARSVLEQEKEGVDEDAFVAFEEELFEDMDFEFLFEDETDDIEASPVGEAMGILSLSFDEWFQPFSDDPAYRAHPYALET